MLRFVGLLALLGCVTASPLKDTSNLPGQYREQFLSAISDLYTDKSSSGETAHDSNSNEDQVTGGFDNQYAADRDNHSKILKSAQIEKTKEVEGEMSDFFNFIRTTLDKYSENDVNTADAKKMDEIVSPLLKNYKTLSPQAKTYYDQKYPVFTKFIQGSEARFDKLN